MTREESIKLLALIKVAYPTAYKDMDNASKQATVNIRKKYGKSAVLKGINLQEGATTIDRNNQIGGHKA